MKENVISTKSFAFAIEIVKLYKHITEYKKEYVLSKQILKSGTSIGANVREGINAQSRADFIQKFHIAQKESSETLYWLELLNETNYIDDETFEILYPKATEVYKIISSIVKSTKEKP